MRPSHVVVDSHSTGLLFSRKRWHLDFASDFVLQKASISLVSLMIGPNAVVEQVKLTLRFGATSKRTRRCKACSLTWTASRHTQVLPWPLDALGLKLIVMWVGWRDQR